MFTLKDEKEEGTKSPGRGAGTARPSRFLALVVAAGLVTGAVIKLFAFELLHVSGSSMAPAIRDGETIFVNKLRFGIARPFSDNLLVRWGTPGRNDVVIYLYDNKIVVKRCVAVGGDSISCERAERNRHVLRAGGKDIPLTDAQYENLKSIREVPDGYVLAVGDNYDESFDSRNYGFIPVKNILGKVLCK